MITEKTKISPRFVMNGQVRVGARPFTCPELVALNKTTVYVAYDTLLDNTIDILDENMDMIGTASALVLAAVKAVA